MLGRPFAYCCAVLDPALLLDGLPGGHHESTFSLHGPEGFQVGLPSQFFHGFTDNSQLIGQCHMLYLEKTEASHICLLQKNKQFIKNSKNPYVREYMHFDM